MAPRKKPFHEELAENLKAQQEGKEPPNKSDEELAVQKKAELDDARRQAEIMNPSGTDIEGLSFKLRLYPYTMDNQAGASGFCDSIMADAARLGASNPVEFAFRMSSLIKRNASTRSELLQYIAVATEKPGVIDSSEQVAEIVKDLREKVQPDDYVKLFNAIQERARVKRAPKA